MGKEELDHDQVFKAASALLKHLEIQKGSKTDLLEESPFIHLQIALMKVPELSSPKPRQIRIPHPLYKAKEDDDVQMCLIVKDDCKNSIKQLLMEDKPVAGLKKVLSLTRLKKDFGRYSDRRELLHAFDIFLADDRILPMLSKALGKKFYRAKRLPVPVKVTRTESLPHRVAAARDSTFCAVTGAGPCVSVRVARGWHSAAQVAANAAAALAGVLAHVPRGWANVKSVNLKTSDSVALPVYAALPAAGTKIELSSNKSKDDIAEESSSRSKKAKKNKKRKRPLLELAAKLQEQAKSNKGVDANAADTEGAADADEGGEEEEEATTVVISAPKQAKKNRNPKKGKKTGAK
mmetsp:Transcript_40037/g.62651  ORF Transcript_40037/g.62651 Transcript_40037/m.62651 type:complete len:349 (+) Transcript_40037:85-1131(+)|eukprot:CAMPEP_0194713402 /NCGR_PEP_ID=MMETSP0296-20130528/5277_1 /TAXON_ID=39354 /ORGANISM="Heterosigma akashiwo, Strain CCMP2393" /LENGTH=348 /DNA_ID=CAMNT_0039612151 /DNA_START=79 /DNA_END=1125 /DNA_ORIENTATION=-